MHTIYVAHNFVIWGHANLLKIEPSTPKLIIPYFGVGGYFGLKSCSEQACERLLKCYICLCKVRLTQRSSSIIKWEKFRLVHSCVCDCAKDKPFFTTLQGHTISLKLSALYRNNIHSIECEIDLMHSMSKVIFQNSHFSV